MNKKHIKEALKIAEWFNILPQAYSEGLTDIRTGDKTWEMIFKQSNRLTKILQSLKDENERF